MMMMMNCFCGMVDRRKAFNVISSRDHCQRSSPSRISDKPRARFEPAQNLSSGLVEWSCSVVITTTPRLKHIVNLCYLLHQIQSGFWHIQKSIYSGIFRHFSAYLALFKYVHAYWCTTHAYSGLVRHIQKCV